MNSKTGNHHALVVSYGGGKNSTAMLIAMWLKGIRPDAILFANTGNEKAETYQFIEFFDEWLSNRSFPPITQVQYKLKSRRRKRVLYPAITSAAKICYWESHNIWSCIADGIIQDYHYQSLGEETILSHYLPSVAYGMAKCSAKWKIEPIRKWRAENFPGGGHIVAIGYHAGEQRRLIDKRTGEIRSLDEGGGWTKWYPLIDWGLDEDDCQRLCQHEIGFIPQKSSCWFCPNARPWEVERLPDDIKILGQDIEGLSDYGAIARGRNEKPARLGRNFRWGDLNSLPDYRKVEPPKPCSCWSDGEQLELNLEIE